MDVINSTSLKVEQQVERFLPKKLAARRRWKRESFGSVASNDEQPRGRSPHNREQHEYADEDQRSSDSLDTGTPSQSRHNLDEDEENVLETLEEYGLAS